MFEHIRQFYAFRHAFTPAGAARMRLLEAMNAYWEE